MLLQPHLCWSKWIKDIAVDQGVDRQRVIDHLKLHFNQHLPPVNAPVQWWTQWLTGTYNLLGILQQLTDSSSTYTLGLDRLFKKWAKDASNHTPPPSGLVDTIRTHCESL